MEAYEKRTTALLIFIGGEIVGHCSYNPLSDVIEVVNGEVRRWHGFYGSPNSGNWSASQDFSIYQKGKSVTIQPATYERGVVQALCAATPGPRGTNKAEDY